MTVVELLMAGRKVLANREQWGRGPFAESCQGRSVAVASPLAARFGPQGALLKSDPEWATYRVAVGVLLESLPGPRRMGTRPTADLWGYNATSSHEEVLAVFDRAIDMARGQYAAPRIVQWVRDRLKRAA